MFFSKNNKLSLGLFVDSLVLFAFDAISEESLEKTKNLLRECDKADNIDERQKQELVIWHMLSVFKAVQTYFNDETKSRVILENFHSKSISKANELGIGENFVNKVVPRYQEYNVLLNDYIENPETGFVFGSSFVKNFFNDSKNTDVILSMAFAGIFTTVFSHLTDFLKETVSKYEITL